MEITFTDNITSRLFDVIDKSISKSLDIKIAVAFIKYSGYSMFEEKINQHLSSGKRIEFIVGLDFNLTEPKVLRSFKKMHDSGLRINFYCFSEPRIMNTPVFHPKLYIFNKGSEAKVIIGSSNFTKGGFKNNIEINTIINASIDEEIISDIYEMYGLLKHQGNKFIPDDEYLNLYEEIYTNFNKVKKRTTRKAKINELIKNIKDREKILPKPQTKPDDLFGWMKVVYEKLPSHPFKASDIYVFEEEFKRKYPYNQNIKAKIRQQLQYLRNIGLLNNPNRNIWIKK